MQDQQANELPGTKSQLTNAIQATEGKLKALRALQPDWARLEQLRSSVIAATSERINQLEVAAVTEAAEAEELHEQHVAVQRQVQVLLLSISLH